MRIGVLGSGVVGQVVGGKLAAIGHEVVLGTRSPGQLEQPKGMAGTLREWLGDAAGRRRVGTFDEAAAHGEVVVNATAGQGSLEALRLAGADNLKGKILIDVSNPLDFSRGMPPSLTVCNTDSLAEQIQRAVPAARVVKTLNTVNAHLMVDPSQLAGGDHHIFISGDDEGARAQVRQWLEEWFGWRHIIDLGGLDSARAAEMLLPIWVRLYGALGTPMFNFRIVR